MLEKIKKYNIVIFGGDNYNTLGMIRTLGENSIDFMAIIIKSGFTLAPKSKYLKNREFFVVESIEEGMIVLDNYKTKLTGKKAFLLVEGDELTGVLDRHYSKFADYFIWNNCGEAGRLTRYLNKKSQVELAENCGIKVLPSVITLNGVVPIGLEYPVITKAVTSEISNWKSEVFICKSEKELMEAFTHIKSKEIMIQKYIVKKNELCIDGYSVNKGKTQFFGIASQYTYLLDFGYSFVGEVSNVKDVTVKEWITRAMTAAGYEGIYSFEFIIDQDDTPYFLEINFRNSGWSYAATCLGMPLPLLWIDSMMSGEVRDNVEKKVPAGYRFISDFADFKTRAGKNMSYWKWLVEYINVDCKLMYGRWDKRPFISYVIQRASHKIKRRIVGDK